MAHSKHDLNITAIIIIIIISKTGLKIGFSPFFMRCCGNPGKYRYQLFTPKQITNLEEDKVNASLSNYFKSLLTEVKLEFILTTFAYQPLQWFGKPTSQNHSRVLLISFPVRVRPRNILWWELICWKNHFTGENLVPLDFKGITDNSVPPIWAEILPCHSIYELNDITSEKQIIFQTFPVHCAGCFYTSSNDTCIGTYCCQLGLTY